MNKTWPEDTTRNADNRQTAPSNNWNIDPDDQSKLLTEQESELPVQESSGVQPSTSVPLDQQESSGVQPSTSVPHDQQESSGVEPSTSVPYDQQESSGLEPSTSGGMEPPDTPSAGQSTGQTNAQKDEVSEATTLSCSVQLELDKNGNQEENVDTMLKPLKRLMHRLEEGIETGNVSASSSLTSITDMTELKSELTGLKKIQKLCYLPNFGSPSTTNMEADLINHDAVQKAYQEMQNQPSTSAAAAASTGRRNRVVEHVQNLLQKLFRALKYFKNDDDSSDNEDDEKNGKPNKKHYELFTNPEEDVGKGAARILRETINSVTRVIRFFNKKRKDAPKNAPKSQEPKGQSSRPKSVDRQQEEWNIVWELCNYSAKTARAFMPEDEVTVISINRGQTLRQALARSMNKRHLDPELYTVYYSNTDEKLDWNMDMALLKRGIDIRVEYNEEHLTADKISHNFVRRTYFTVVHCKNCNTAMFHGFGCDLCGDQFHRCYAQSLPTLCQPFRVNNFYQQVMAFNLDSLHPLNLQSNSGNSVSNPQLNQGFGSNSGTYLEVPPIRSVSPPQFCMDGSSMATIDTDERTRSPRLIYHYYPVKNETESDLTPDLERFFERLPEVFLLNNQPRSQSQPCLADTSSPANADTLDSKDWHIDQETIQFGKLVSSGSFGAVYIGAYNQVPVALKKLRMANLTAQQQRQFERDIEAVYKLNHLNLVQLFGCMSKPQWTLVTRWCRGRTLYRFLHMDHLQLEAEEMLDIARQISDGMNYLHSKLIIHRNLKSTNIFLHDDFVVKISDYGLPIAKLQWNGIPNSILPNGIDLWMAPEVMRTSVNDPFTTNSDVYAFGIVLFEMCTGRLPFQDISDEQMIDLGCRNLLQPGLYLVRSEHTPKQYVGLMKKCLLTDSERRPSFVAIRKHLEAIIETMPKMCKNVGSCFDVGTVAKTNQDPDDAYVDHHHHYGVGKKCALYKRLKLTGFTKTITFKPFYRLANKRPKKKNNDPK